MSDERKPPAYDFGDGHFEIHPEGFVVLVVLGVVVAAVIGYFGG